MSSQPIASRRTLLSGVLGATALGATLGASTARSAAAVTVPSSPSSSFFLEMPPIRGESTDEAHRDTIELLDWSVGVDNTATPTGGGGGGRGRSTPRPFTAIARSSIASPKLFLAAAQSTRFQQARLFAVKNGESPFEYLLITLGGVSLSSYAMAPDDIDAHPIDVFELVYASLQMSWFPQGDDGGAGTPVVGSFDFQRGR